ncbi:MAG: phosphodiester glycosidase family protein, partial [Clostridia bacterium]|nr:phosphodiester glycosidase family protein [Clostridia bacterium]
GYMGNCDDASDELNIYLCNAAGELLEYPEWYMRVGEEYQFRYRLRNATGYPEVTWSVSDTTILRVLNTGLVVAVREGEAVLTVSVGHVSCSLRIVVEGVAGSDVDITDYIIFNEFLIDESTMVNSPLYTGVTKGLACKYYIADVHDFVAARTESSAFEDHDSTCMTIWKESDRYGTNSVLCNGDQDLAAILVYDEENLQYNARMLDGETGKYLEKPTNGNSSHGWGLLVFRNDCVEPEIYTYKKYLEGDNDELPKKIGDIWLAMGGINLFADLADLTLEEKTLISNDILQKGDFDNYDEFRNTFVNLYKYWSYACKQDEAHRPRTAIGYNSIAQKVVLAIIFDGSNIDSHIIPDSGELGANLYDVRQIMKYLGCNKVLNLDGGGSTRISYKRHGIKRSCYVGSREIFADIFINPDRIENVLWAADA